MFQPFVMWFDVVFDDPSQYHIKLPTTKKLHFRGPRSCEVAIFKQIIHVQPRKINMKLENTPLEKEHNLPNRNHYFSGSSR